VPSAASPLIEVVWSAAALANLHVIRAYLAQFNPTAATRLSERLILAGQSLRQFPERGRPVPGTAMRELLSISPYIIRYRISGNRVIILRVRHGAQRPTNP